MGPTEPTTTFESIRGCGNHIYETTAEDMDRWDSGNPSLAAVVSEDLDDPCEKQERGGCSTQIHVSDHGTERFDARSDHCNGNLNCDNRKDALDFLVQYEIMIQQQEAENLVTLDHMQATLERLQQVILGSPSQQIRSNNRMITTGTNNTCISTGDRNGCVWQRKIRFSDLQCALERLELQGTMECLTIDRQLMMVLRVILERANLSSSSGRNETEGELEMSGNTTPLDITWAEFVQCYKTCIVGMQTLQLLPGPSLARDRSRDRTLAMMSLFDMESTSSINRFSATVAEANHRHGNGGSAILDKPRAMAVPSGPLSQSLQHSTEIHQNLGMQTPHGGSDNGTTYRTTPFRSTLFLLFVVVLSSSCSLWLQHYFQGVTYLEATLPVRKTNAKPEPKQMQSQQKQPVPNNSLPQQPMAYKQPLTDVQQSICSATMAGRSAATVREEKETTASFASVEQQTPKAQVNENNYAPTVLGAVVVGPVAAFLSQAWQAGPLASAYSFLPAIVFGAGIVSLASVAIHSVQSLLLKFFAQLRKKQPWKP